MTATSLLAATAIVLEVLPVMCHRLITNPYPEREWDSIIVSSDPITVREKKRNETTPMKLTQKLRPQKRSYEECPENDFGCLYGNSEGGKGDNKIIDKFLQRYSQIADVKFVDGENSTEEAEKENENGRQSYWTMIDSQTHHHPYDDKKGWVTLDPVPWSTSKISKWHPNKPGTQQETKPWALSPTTQRPVQQFWVSGSSFHTQRPSSHWGLGTNDIITDNKPSDFPTDQYNGYGNSNQGSQYRPQNGFYGYPGTYPEYHKNQEFQGSYPPKIPQNGHPSTYPSHGDGEWVLLSTTKGYSIPQRHRWAGQKDDRFFSSRKIKPVDISRYHEEELKEKLVEPEPSPTGNRKSDGSVDGSEDSKQDDVSNEKTPIQVLYTGSPDKDESVKTFKRKVRLQVLPALENTSTSYGGLLEVDSNLQTVDEAQQEDEKMQQLKAIANVKKNRIRGYKLVPTSKITGKGMNHKSMMTLAAVGAGMIPATMALLVPMALGRRRRSSSDSFLGYDKMDDGGDIKELKEY